jgi:hypothetical protein
VGKGILNNNSIIAMHNASCSHVHNGKLKEHDEAKGKETTPKGAGKRLSKHGVYSIFSTGGGRERAGHYCA